VALGNSVKRFAALNSWATRRLNSMLWERCLAMAFILRIQSPAMAHDQWQSASKGGGCEPQLRLALARRAKAAAKY